MTTTITSITVYWESDDPDDEGWVYRFTQSNGDTIDSGPLDCDDLSSAIEEAILLSGLPILADEFASHNHDVGGYAVWTNE